MSGGGDDTASDAAASQAIRLLLVGVQSPINLDMILRVAETFRIGVDILRSDGLLDDADRMRTVSDSACGALQRVGYGRRDPRLSLVDPGRRLVATTIEADAVPPPAFRFAPGDVIALGNEYDGLAPEINAAAAARLSIPMADVFTPKPLSARPIDPTRPAAPRPTSGARTSTSRPWRVLCATRRFRRSAATRRRDADSGQASRNSGLSRARPSGPASSRPSSGTPQRRRNSRIDSLGNTITSEGPAWDG